MLIEILKRTTCGGRQVDAGEMVEASQRDADTLVAMGKAREIKAEDASPTQRMQRRGRNRTETTPAPAAHNAGA